METSALSPDLPLESGARPAVSTTVAGGQVARPAPAGRRLDSLDAAKGIGIILRVGGKLLFAECMAAVCFLGVARPDFGDVVATHITWMLLLFYALGICLGDAVIAARDRTPRPAMILLICAAAWFASACTVWAADFAYSSVAALPGACAGTAGVIILSRNLPSGLCSLLAQVGRLLMPIYVLHVLFTASTRIALEHRLQWHDPLIVLPVIIAAGLIGPLTVHALARRARIDRALGLA
jgi:surface polysaccharide O-acyltransferase-like enzyme